jgi:hypothetical protein
MDALKNLGIFAAVYIPTLLLLWWTLRNRHRERCDRCGQVWKHHHSHDFHICDHRRRA